jgi:hypothetical protein
MAQLAATTSLVGTVVDTSGAAVPNANIVAIEVMTGDTYRAVTDVEGNYNFPFVRDGTYTVTASIKGFRTDTHKDIIVEINRTVRVDFALQVGMVTQTVTVSGGAPPIATYHSMAAMRKCSQSPHPVSTWDLREARLLIPARTLLALGLGK